MLLELVQTMLALLLELVLPLLLWCLLLLLLMLLMLQTHALGDKHRIGRRHPRTAAQLTGECL